MKFGLKLAIVSEFHRAGGTGTTASSGPVSARSARESCLDGAQVKY